MTGSGQNHNLKEFEYNEWKRIERLRFELVMNDPKNKEKYDDWVDSIQELEIAFRNLLTSKGGVSKLCII